MPMNITFSEGSGLNDSIYGKCQAPIRMFLEQRGEQFEQQSVIKDLFLMGTSDNYGDMMTTMTAMDEVVKAAEAAGIRNKVKIMVGGAPVDQRFCDHIGADAYTRDAASAADAAVAFMNK